MIGKKNLFYSYFFIKHILREDFMQCFCIISHYPSPLERRFRDIQIVITNFVVVSSVGIKRVDCILINYV